MEILIAGKKVEGNSDEEKMKKLFAELHLEEMRFQYMYTLPMNKYLNRYYQFRAWSGPFANVSNEHADTGYTNPVFEIKHEYRSDLFEFVKPIIRGRAMWTTENNSCNLWLAGVR